jgi:hypothetical protein
VTDPPHQLPASVERDAESAELYAPPREDRPPPEDAFAPKNTKSPGLVGLLALLLTTSVSSAAAAGLMVFWYNITPISSGFLSGLKETILAFLAWSALSAFALVGGIFLATGVLSQDGKMHPLATALTVVLAVGAGVVCFIPDPAETYVYRGLLGLLSLVITFGLTMGVLKYARRRYMGPPPPPPWMDA